MCCFSLLQKPYQVLLLEHIEQTPTRTSLNSSADMEQSPHYAAETDKICAWIGVVLCSPKECWEQRLTAKKAWYLIYSNPTGTFTLRPALISHSFLNTSPLILFNNCTRRVTSKGIPNTTSNGQVFLQNKTTLNSWYLPMMQELKSLIFWVFFF